MKKLLVVAALILTAGTAFAAGTKEARPVACVDYSIAKLADGSTLGVCNGAPDAMGRKGKKPRFLSSYAVTSLKDPSGAAVSVLVGFP